jgi:uncharacterized protein (TIGR02271 family)
MKEQIILQNGMDVYGADDAKLGSIHDIRENYFVIEKGFFFPKDYYVPVSAVAGVDADDRVFLNVTKDVALNQGWDVEPETLDTTGAYPATDQATVWSAGSKSGSTAAPADFEQAAKARGQSSEVIDPNYVAATDKPASGADATRVPVYEEEITPVKRAVDRGKVRIEKEVVTENRTITVPVTEERVRVTRVDTDETVTANTGDAFQEGVIEVPLRGEEVDVQKTAHKTGEVVVEKEAVQRNEQVSGDIRREKVRVDDKTVQSSDTPKRKSA